MALRKPDYATGIAADASGIYVTGYTDGTLPGESRSGNGDAFVAKFDTEGNLLWTRQFGSVRPDYGWSIATAPGGVYVAGYTDGALPGEVHLGDKDAFVVKFDTAGNLLWTQQFGSPGWTRDFAWGVAADASGVYVTGETRGTLPGQVASGPEDAFVVKFDAAGDLLWTSQFGSTSYDIAYAITAGAGGVYVTGTTSVRNVSASGDSRGDVFVAKFDESGNLLWNQSFGSAKDELARAIAVDGTRVYVAGYTKGRLAGVPKAGNWDVFLAGLDTSGNLISIAQFGSADYEYALGVAVDNQRGLHGRIHECHVARSDQPWVVKMPFLAKFNPCTPLAEEDFSATIDWGDGTTEPAADIALVETPGGEGVLTTGTIDAEHAYADAGTYTVTVPALG